MSLFVKNRLLFVLISAFSLSFISSCNKNKDDGSINIFTVEDDKALGEQLKAEIDSHPELYNVMDRAQYPAAYQHLDRISTAILNSGKVFYKDEFNWEFFLIHDDSTLNAFAAPGGKIYIYTGLIRYLDAEYELAGVIAHEIAHADRRHSTDQLTRLYGIGLLLDVVFGQDRSQLADIAASLAVLKYNRDQESESDEYSVIYLNETEYDARGAARFFEKLIAQGAGGSPEFLSTHPNPDNRVEAIIAKWESLGSKPGGTFIERYQEFKNTLP